jgi:HD-like signal output (HDOD) protein/CheY-like chemotaxis protein
VEPGTVKEKPMTKRILFVDDDPNVLQGLQRMLRSLRQEWDMFFVHSGREALDLLAHQCVDVIVSDMRMPEMDGAQLLNEVRQRCPHMVRIILSGHSDREMLLRSVGPAHQFLAKPCDADMLKSTIARACALRDLLRDEMLKRLVAGMQTLPSLPTLYLEVLETAQAADGSLEKIGKIIERDISMTAKILQLVNSAFFGLGRHISTPVQAVSLLGLDTVKALILSSQVFSNFDPVKTPGLCLDTLWQHSMAVGVCAKAITKAENGAKRLIDDAFMAGLLHDVGKLVLAVNLPQLYSRALSLVQTEGVTEWDAERHVLGATHAEVGAYLLGLWGLPDSIVEALAFHHSPSACPDCTLSPLTAVHVADALVYEEQAVHGETPKGFVDQAYLAELGVEECLARWRQDYQSTLIQGGRI